MSNYNYVFFNTVDNVLCKDKNGYYDICIRDLEKMENVKVVSYPAERAIKPFRYLYKLHQSDKINKKIKLPFKGIWNSSHFKDTFPVKRKLCFVFTNTWLSLLPENYFYYLKKKYLDAKFIVLFRDLISIHYNRFPQHIDLIENFFDLKYSYDMGESEAYGCVCFDEFESKIEVPKAENYPLSDVFFAGRAKDRLPKILEAYRRFTEAGLTCDFYLTGVSKEEQIPLNGVVYADKSMPYSEVLYRTVNARCVLEINQAGAVGYTSRFLESVLYNKRLITDNASIQGTQFYNPKYIRCISSMQEIDPSFVTEDVGEIDYGYSDEFSPVRLIANMERELAKLDERK